MFIIKQTDTGLVFAGFVFRSHGMHPTWNDTANTTMVCLYPSMKDVNNARAQLRKLGHTGHLTIVALKEA